MKTVKVTTTYTVYEYPELNDSAKETVRQWYLDHQRSFYDFEDIVMENVWSLFPNSDLKVQCSLSHCQGDGLNIYGELNLLDMLEQIKHDFTNKEYKKLVYYFTNFGNVVRLEANYRYCYCIADRYDYTYGTLTEMEQRYIRDVDIDLLNKFDALAARKLTILCSQYETYGYDYLYEVDEGELLEVCEANDWRFLEDGQLFAGK